MIWPTKKLGEVLIYEQPSKYIVSSKNYNDSYKTPVLTAGKTFILGNTNETRNIFPVDKLPVVIFDDFTTAIQFVDFSFKVKSSAMKILHAKKDVSDIRYLFYLLQTISINHNTHKRYWISEFSELEIPLPPLKTQKEIVEKLDKKFAKLNEARKMREEALAGTEKILSQTLHEIFENGKKKGWKFYKLEDMTENKKTGIKIGPFGSSLKKHELVNNGYSRVLFIENIVKNKFDDTKKKYITKEKFIELETFLVKPKDILITMMGTIGRTGIVPENFGTAIISSHLTLIRLNQSRVLSEYINYFLQSDELLKIIHDQAKGAIMKGLNSKIIRNLELPLPSLSEQKKIVEKLDMLSEKITKLKELQKLQLEDFKKLEKACLREAFSGELIK